MVILGLDLGFDHEERFSARCGPYTQLFYPSFSVRLGMRLKW